jgi:hypothetical protein
MKRGMLLFMCITAEDEQTINTQLEEIFANGLPEDLRNNELIARAFAIHKSSLVIKNILRRSMGQLPADFQKSLKKMVERIAGVYPARLYLGRPTWDKSDFEDLYQKVCQYFIDDRYNTFWSLALQNLSPARLKGI